MGISDQILLALHQCQGFVSGEMLASTLGISRAAVSQHVAELKKDGWHITAVSRRGYQLENDRDIFNANLLAANLSAKGITCQVKHFHSIGSTNTWARENMASLAALSLVCADSQSQGRGRFERHFHSPAQSGLYCSLILRDRLPVETATLLTCAAAVAVRRALWQQFTRDTSIKWVNDLYYAGRKVAGILTEGTIDVESHCLVDTIIGIGINLYGSALPSELGNIAGTIDAPTNRPSRHILAVSIVEELLGLLHTLPNADFMNEYRSASLVLNQQVEVIRGSQRASGTAIDIDNEGRLIVLDASGQRQIYNSGEVSVILGS